MKKSSILYNGFTLFLLISITYLSLTSKTVNLYDMNNIDKIQHVIAYAFFAFFCSLSISSWGLGRFKYVLTIFICAIIGGSLELIQSRYGRMAEYSDFAADVIGSVIGCLGVKFYLSVVKD